MEYSFHFYNGMAETGILTAMGRMAQNFSSAPIVLCIGSDLAIGDSLGPIVGTMLKKKGYGGVVYGTLTTPVTAKEVKYINNFLQKTHPNSPVIAVDAAVGDEIDIGLIKVTDTALKPGSGANKRLGKVGDLSIMGIVAGRGAFAYSALSLTRLNMVYAMAEVISDAILSFFLGETAKGRKNA